MQLWGQVKLCGLTSGARAGSLFSRHYEGRWIQQRGQKQQRMPENERKLLATYWNIGVDGLLSLLVWVTLGTVRSFGS